MFLPAQLDVLGAEVPWRATIAIGAAGAATLVGLSDPGGAVTHDDVGVYTLTFPASATRFVDGMSADDPTGSLSHAHPHVVASGTMEVHTEINGTQGDLNDGARVYISLILRNP